MKTIRHYMYLFYILSICTSCADASKNRGDKAIVIAIDYTDSLLLYPTSNDVLHLTELDINPWQGVTLEIIGISDKDVNISKTFNMPSGNRLIGNIQQRTALVEKFKLDVDQYLKQTQYKRELEHSIIYRTIANCLNKLSSIKSVEKQLVVYSNLMENAEVDFYDSTTFKQIQSNYGKVKQKMQLDITIQNGKGIEVLFLYNPISFDDNSTYRITSNFFKKLLEENGAIVHVGLSVNQ